jgi:hypothetical protein
MPATGSTEQGGIGQQEFFTDRFGLNALHQYPKRFHVLAVMQSSMICARAASRYAASEIIFASSNDIRLALAKRSPFILVKPISIACAGLSALVLATAHMLLILDNACSSATIVGSGSDSGTALPSSLGS